MDKKECVLEAAGGAPAPQAGPATFVHPPPPPQGVIFRIPGGRGGRGRPEVALTRHKTPEGVGGLFSRYKKQCFPYVFLFKEKA